MHKNNENNMNFFCQKDLNDLLKNKNLGGGG